MTGEAFLYEPKQTNSVERAGHTHITENEVYGLTSL
jgi:hypothetical protein